MQAISPSNKPNFPLIAPVLTKIDAIDVVSSVFGAKTFVLRGFPASVTRGPAWAHPTVPFVSAHDAEHVSRDKKQASRGRWMVGLVALGILSASVLGVALGALLASSKVNMIEKVFGSGAVWEVVDVRPQGILVYSEEHTTLVPVGGKLPNGEILLTVLPDKKAAVFGNGTWILHSKKGNAP